MTTIRMLGTLLLAGVYTLALAQRSGNDLFQQALMKERSQGDLKGAIDIYQRIVKEFASDRRLAARALLEMARCQEKQGGEQARRTYERLLKEYSDQAEQATEARARIAALAVPASSTSPRVRQLWVKETGEWGSISADGRWLTYTHWETGDLGLRDLLNNTNKLLTNTGGWEKSGGQFVDTSLISPDGKRIAYNLWVAARSYELLVMNADGSGVRTLGWAGVPRWVAPGAWSPDGKMLAVMHVAPGGLTSLHMVSLPSGERRELIPAGAFFGSQVSFSPDGKWLVLVGRGSDGSKDLFTLAAAGGKPEPLVTHPSNDTGPYWSADGRSVLFLSDRSGSYGIWQVAVENGRAAGPPELVRGDLGTNVRRAVGFTSAGSYAYSVQAGGPEIYTVDFDPASGKVTGKPVMVSDRRPGFNASPRLSPDGSRLAYFTAAGAQEIRVTIRDLASFAERTLPSLLRVDALSPSAVWTPDGSKLLLEQRTKRGDIELFWLDAQSGQMTLFRTIEKTGGQLSPQFSADGKTLYLSVHQTPEHPVVALDVVSGRQTTLYKGTRQLDGPRRGIALSPDGKWLAGVRRTQEANAWELFLAPTGGGEPRVVAGYRDSGFDAAPVFSQDGKSVFLCREPGELTRIDLSTGAVESAGLNLRGLHSVQMHPSGRKIFFQAGQGREEIWIAENLLPRNGR